MISESNLDPQVQKRKTLLKGNLEVCSELSFMESEEDDKFTTKFPPPYNPQMKAAFQTVND